MSVWQDVELVLNSLAPPHRSRHRRLAPGETTRSCSRRPPMDAVQVERDGRACRLGPPKPKRRPTNKAEILSAEKSRGTFTGGTLQNTVVVASAVVRRLACCRRLEYSGALGQRRLTLVPLVPVATRYLGTRFPPACSTSTARGVRERMREENLPPTSGRLRMPTSRQPTRRVSMRCWLGRADCRTTC